MPTNEYAEKGRTLIKKKFFLKDLWFDTKLQRAMFSPIYIVSQKAVS